MTDIRSACWPHAKRSCSYGRISYAIRQLFLASSRIFSLSFSKRSHTLLPDSWECRTSPKPNGRMLPS